MKEAAIQPAASVDVESLRLPDRAPKPLNRRFRQGENFLRGPIDWAWLCAAARLPGKALAVGLAIWLLAGFRNDYTIELSRGPLESQGVSRQAGYRGLSALESAGLIQVERRPGRKARVTILLDAAALAKSAPRAKKKSSA